MSEVLKFRKHIETILEAIDEGEYKKQTIRRSHIDENTGVEHIHNVSYTNYEGELYTDYSYHCFKNKRESEIRLDIESYHHEDKTNPQKSLLFFGDRNEVVFKFHPKTLDDIQVRLRSKDDEVELVQLKNFLTEEQYFMYTTLYDLPEFTEIFNLMVMAHELRGHLLHKKYTLSGMFVKEVQDIGSEYFLSEVRFG